jgi:hypothetical protein
MAVKSMFVKQQAAPVALTEEEAALEQEVKAEVAKDKTRKLYELLIKSGDNSSLGGYKEGDIVMIKPAGYLWGTEEKEKFFIVKAYLIPQEAQELMSPQPQGVKGKAGLAGRRKIDIPKGATPDLLSAPERDGLKADITAVEEKR